MLFEFGAEFPKTFKFENDKSTLRYHTALLRKNDTGSPRSSDSKSLM
jgi:hypothetical protein